MNQKIRFLLIEIDIRIVKFREDFSPHQTIRLNKVVPITILKKKPFCYNWCHLIHLVTYSCLFFDHFFCPLKLNPLFILLGGSGGGSRGFYPT